MRNSAILIALLALVLAIPAAAQQTPPTMVQAYDALATTILDLRDAEADYVKAILAGHYHGAEILMQRGKYEASAAEMALFANEGDNAVGGVRKRLIEGGHHHNAAGEEAGIYEPGYVIVTREAKQQLLAASSAMRQAKDDAGRKAAWKSFETVAKPLITN